MSRWFLLLFLAASLAAAQPLPERHPAKTAYVARIVSARALPPGPCPDRNACQAFNVGYELQLEVVEPIFGRAQPGLRTVTIHMHRGFPQFGHYEHAFVFEFAMPQGGVLSGEGYPVAKTRNGPWAFCADGDNWVPIPGRRVRFTAPIRFNAATREFHNGYLPESGMPEGKRECHRGIWAEELANYYEKLARPALPAFISYQLQQE